jgi:hypothetical protein
MSGRISTIAIGAGNTVITGDGAEVSACNGGAAPVRTLGLFRMYNTSAVTAVAIGQDGRLFVACGGDPSVFGL